MRRSLLPALVLAFGLAGCGSGDAPVAELPISLVIGVEAACASRIDAVHLSARDAATIVFQHDYLKLTAQSFPLFARLSLADRAGAVYQVTASFHLKPVGGQETPISPSLSVLVPAGTAGRLVVSLPCVCLSMACPEGENCAELPLGSGHAQCVASYQCGNQACEPGETYETCPKDCGAKCGDGVCSSGETCGSCAKDCGSCCGNGKCDPLEDCTVCATDCGSCAKCSNAVCELTEDCDTCPADCPCLCGDGKCNGSETCNNCPKDCGSCCGNLVCETGETCQLCPKDCGACPKCGDGLCTTSIGETCQNCKTDCGPCTSGTCNPPCACGTSCDAATATCQPFDTCVGKQCGDDGCGSSCGTCSSSQAVCVDNKCCATGTGCSAASCWQIDECGKPCATCPSGTFCVEGTGCVAGCSCDGKECGDDGCGGDCGACWPGDVCENNTCVCYPDCNGKDCGWDGCAGECGYCLGTDVCEASSCRACQSGMGCYEWACWELDECYDSCSPCTTGYHCVTNYGCEAD